MLKLQTLSSKLFDKKNNEKNFGISGNSIPFQRLSIRVSFSIVNYLLFFRCCRKNLRNEKKMQRV